MLRILSQTNLDTTMFIGADEPNYKIVGLNLGLFEKGFICEGMGAIATTFMNDGTKDIEGLRTRFTKSNNQFSASHSNRYANRYQQKTFFKRKTNIDNTIMELTVSNVSNRFHTEISLRITPSPQDCQTLLDYDIVSKYSKHVKTTETMTILPEIRTNIDLKADDFNPKKSEDIEAAKLHLDAAVVKTKEFEENFKYLYPLLVLRNFSGINNLTMQKISLSEFDKFSRVSEIIGEVSIPTKDARTQFIELCDIFKNNTVLPKLKANNFEFRKEGGYLSVSLFGIQLIREENFKHFKYLDHPSINFCADYLDISKTLNTIETKISKEIFTRI